MAREVDWELLSKAADVTGSALRGAMGGEGSQPPKFAADVFREVWAALKEASEELQGKGKAGF
jgi:hypothetical protein